MMWVAFSQELAWCQLKNAESACPHGRGQGNDIAKTAMVPLVSENTMGRAEASGDMRRRREGNCLREKRVFEPVGCRSAAPPSRLSRCFNTNGEGVVAF